MDVHGHRLTIAGRAKGIVKFRHLRLSANKRRLGWARRCRGTTDAQRAQDLTTCRPAVRFALEQSHAQLVEIAWHIWIDFARLNGIAGLFAQHDLEEFAAEREPAGQR